MSAIRELIREVYKEAWRAGRLAGINHEGADGWKNGYRGCVAIAAAEAELAAREGEPERGQTHAPPQALFADSFPPPLFLPDDVLAAAQKVTEWAASRGLKAYELCGIRNRWPEPQAARWQPIESAPKDGTLILAWFRAQTYYPAHIGLSRWWEGDKFNAPNWADGGGLGEPTHWQPLPAPPEGDDAQAPEEAAERDVAAPD
jgi:hypothetical protein